MHEHFAGVKSILHKLEGAQQQTGGSSAQGRHASSASMLRRVASSNACPDPSQVPALLADGLARLERLVSLSQPAIAAPHGGSFLSAGPPGAGVTGSSSMLAALQLEGAERRAGQMREAYHAAAAERDRLAAQVKELQQASVTRNAFTPVALTGIAVPSQHPADSNAAGTADAGRVGISTNPVAGAAGESSGMRQQQLQFQLPPQSQHLVGLLRTSIIALHGACAQLEASCSSPAPSASELKRCSGQVVSEVLGLEATLGLLVTELSTKSQGGSCVAGPPSGSGADPEGAAGIHPEEDGRESSEAGSFAFQTNMHNRSSSTGAAGSMQATARGVPALHTPAEVPGCMSEGSRSPDSTSSSSVPSLSDVLRPAPITGLEAISQMPSGELDIQA
jgi:hypothetical protein